VAAAEPLPIACDGDGVGTQQLAPTASEQGDSCSCIESVAAVKPVPIACDSDGVGTQQLAPTGSEQGDSCSCIESVAAVEPCHHAADEHGASEGGDGEAMPRASGGGSGRDAAGDEADGGGGDEHGASEGGDGTARCQLL